MKRWASLLGWLGAVCLIFAFVSALVELFSSGVFVIDALLDQFAWSVGNLALGLACVIVALVATGSIGPCLSVSSRSCTMPAMAARPSPSA